MSFRNRVKTLRMIPAGELLANPKNWRTHNEKQSTALRAIMAEVGFAGAVLARELPDGQVELIDGHLRASEVPAGEAIPVLILDVTEAEALKILATFDPISAMAGANVEMLDRLLSEVKTENDDLNSLFKELLQQANRNRAKGEVIDVPIPEVPDVPTTRRGDLYVLGRHRLLCGDSTSQDDVKRLLAGSVPRIMVTDPPYGVNYDPTWRHDAGLNKSKRVGKVKNDDRADWTDAWKLFPGSVAYVWHGGLHSATVQESLIKAGFLTKAQIIWVKPKMVMGRGHYHWKHEPAFHVERPENSSDHVEAENIEQDDCDEVWYATRKGKNANWLGGRKQTTVWEIGFSQEVTTVHGTQKPVECMARPIRNHCSFSDFVYEPFCGSGTTLIAAEQLGNGCFAMELSEQYCDVIVKRWENLTGLKAELMKA